MNYNIIYEPTQSHLSKLDQIGTLLHEFSGKVSYESVSTGEIFYSFVMENGEVVSEDGESAGRTEDGQYDCYPDQQWTVSNVCYANTYVGSYKTTTKVYKSVDHSTNKATWKGVTNDNIIIDVEIVCMFDKDFSECDLTWYNTEGYTLIPQYARGSGTLTGITLSPIFEPTNLPNDNSLKEYFIELIDDQTDPERRRKLQLDYIAQFDGDQGKDFKELIEELLRTPNLTLGEVTDINIAVDNYYGHLIGRYMMAIYGPVAELSKPFIEMALFETGAGVLFQAVKGVLSVNWGLQLSKLGVNTISISALTTRIVNGLRLSSDSKLLTILVGGRNITGTAAATASSSRVAYRFSNVTSTQARAIFEDMVAGRELKKLNLGGGKTVESVSWIDSNGIRNSITFRNFSSSGQVGDTIIQINVAGVRSGTMELKFLL